MKNEKPSLTFHPFVRQWMKKFSLVLGDTYTELGYVACPVRDKYPRDFSFTFDDLQKDIARLNSLYGTSFDDKFLDVRLKGRNTLREVIGQTSEVNRAMTILPELGTKDERIYVGGLRIPKRDYLYIESHKLSSELKDSYSLGDREPILLKCVTFIPVAKEYRPKF